LAATAGALEWLSLADQVAGGTHVGILRVETAVQDGQRARKAAPPFLQRRPRRVVPHEELRLRRIDDQDASRPPRVAAEVRCRGGFHARRDLLPWLVDLRRAERRRDEHRRQHYNRFLRRRCGLRPVEGKISCPATGGCSRTAPARRAKAMNRSWLRSGGLSVCARS